MQDAEGDKISRPNRPIVTGEISKFEAWLSGALIYAILVVFLFNMPPLATIILSVIIIMSILYSFGPKFKDLFLISGLYLGTNLTLAILFTSAYLTGTIVPNALLFALIIFPIMFAAGYAKDFLDFEADKLQNRKNLLVSMGLEKGSEVIITMTILMITLSIIFSSSLIGVLSFIFIVPLAALIVAGIRLVKDTTTKNGHKFYINLWRLRVGLCGYIVIIFAVLEPFIPFV